MSLSRVLDNDESSSLSASSLGKMVKENNLEKIKAVVRHLKDEDYHSSLWWVLPGKGNLVEDAVRDAILLGQLETVQFFLNEGVPARSKAADLSRNKSSKASFISFAARTGNLPITMLLVERGADIEPYKHYSNSGDDSAIEEAVKSGHADVADYLLQHGANANAHIRYDETLLTMAADKDNLSLIEILIKHGANIQDAFYLIDDKYKQLTNDNKNALRHNRIIKTLLDYTVGSDLFYNDDFDDLSFLRNMDISGFNFVGLSVNGIPVTHERLSELQLKGANQAIVTEDDLNRLQATEPDRYIRIRKQLNEAIKKQGLLFSKPGVYNLLPLLRAAEIGDEAAVNARLEAGVTPNEGKYKKPIILATKNKHINIVRRLGEHPLIDKKSIVSALEKATKINDQKLISYLSSINDVNMLNMEGEALLHVAVNDRDIVKMIKLIASGADVNLENKDRCTPLSIAARNAKLDPVQIHLGLAAIDTEIVRILLAHQADPNKYNYESPLQLAVDAGNVSMVSLLLPVTTKNELIIRDGQKVICHEPWYVGMMFDALYRVEAIALLTQLKIYGADFNKRNQVGDTLLHTAVLYPPSCEQAEALKRINYLLSNEADINASNNDGFTPLHYAAAEDNVEAAQLFLERGADPSVSNKDGLTPSQLAAKGSKVQSCIDAFIHDKSKQPHQSKGAAVTLSQVGVFHHCVENTANSIVVKIRKRK